MQYDNEESVLRWAQELAEQSFRAIARKNNKQNPEADGLDITEIEAEEKE